MKSILRKVTPSFLWRLLVFLNGYRKDWLFRLLDKKGFVAVRKSDYYSPLPIVEQIAKTQDRWNKPSALVGLRIDREKLEKQWEEMACKFQAEYDILPVYEEIQKMGYGVGFTATDARTLYYMIRTIKPRRYIEVGSGISTFYTSLAGERNTEEGFPLDIICIEPYPRDNFRLIKNIEFHKNFVQDMPLSFFDRLEPGDVLFIDSSHAAKIDSDVVYELLEIVPRLKPGVYVHIHDIPFPYNFPHPADLYIFNRAEPQLWNEAYIVQAFLSFNQAFEIVQCVSYINHYHPEFVSRHIPERTNEVIYRNVIGSIWLRRIG